MGGSRQAISLELFGWRTHKESRPGNGPVESDASGIDPIRSTVTGLNGQPVLARDASVWKRSVVVGVDVIIAPATARRSSVFTTGRGILTRTKDVLGRLVQTNDARRGGAQAQSQGSKNERLHCEYRCEDLFKMNTQDSEWTRREGRAKGKGTREEER